MAYSGPAEIAPGSANADKSRLRKDTLVARNPHNQGQQMNGYNADTSDISTDIDTDVGLRADSPQPDLDEEVLAAIEVHLDSLPPRKTMTLEKALVRLAPAVRRLREKGYTVAEAAAELTRELSAMGMTVSGRTLARLLPSKAPAKSKRKST